MIAIRTSTQSFILEDVVGRPSVHEIVGEKDESRSPILVVHGGPGMEHSYLLQGLSPLSGSRRLLFYDQLGSGADRTPADQLGAQELTTQLCQVIEALLRRESTLGILAHSWGTFLTIEALMKLPRLIKELVLVNPMPLTWSRFLQSGERLMTRVPTETASQIERLEAEGTEEAGLQVMELALPAYLSPKSSGVRVDFKSYRPQVNAKIFSSIEGYDQSQYDFETFLPGQVLLVYGQDDFNAPEDSKELWGSGKVVTLQAAGHFPFYECRTKFVEAVSEFLIES